MLLVSFISLVLSIIELLHVLFKSIKDHVEDSESGRYLRTSGLPSPPASPHQLFLSPPCPFPGTSWLLEPETVLPATVTANKEARKTLQITAHNKFKCGRQEAPSLTYTVFWFPQWQAKFLKKKKSTYWTLAIVDRQLFFRASSHASSSGNDLEIQTHGWTCSSSARLLKEGAVDSVLVFQRRWGSSRSVSHEA